ncbi:MAG: phosphonate metabolism transcriptional regulator PhnF [Rhodospirillaceae bacterium]
MSIDRSNGVPLWKQIRQIIENDIETGVSAPGDRLPTELEFASRFGVNRHTVRQAIADLVGRGVLRVEQGRGTFVQERVIDYRLGDKTRFHAVLSELNRNASGQLIATDEVVPDKAIADALSLDPGRSVIRLDSQGEADGRCICVSTHFFPKERCGDIGEQYRKSGSVGQALTDMGVLGVRRTSTRVSARLPSAADADRLGQPRNRPVLVAESVNVDKEDRPVEYSVLRFASDWVQLVFDY